MPALKEATSSRNKKTATPTNGEVVKPRSIKITKKLAEQIRTISTEGWIQINPSDGKWKVRKYGNVRASGIYEKLETAIAAAKKISHSSPNARIFIFDRNANVVQTIHQ